MRKRKGDLTDTRTANSTPLGSLCTGQVGVSDLVLCCPNLRKLQGCTYASTLRGGVVCRVSLLLLLLSRGRYVLPSPVARRLRVVCPLFFSLGDKQRRQQRVKLVDLILSLAMLFDALQPAPAHLDSARHTARAYQPRAGS